MYQKLFENWRGFRLLNEIRIEGGMTIRDILNTLEIAGDKTWIVFDTETMGFNPVSDQITEIAAVAIKPNNWDDPTSVDTYHRKIPLLPSTHGAIQYSRKKTGLTPAIRPPEGREGQLTKDELLQMTGYGSFGPEGQIVQDPQVAHDPEQKALKGFYDFCEKHGGPENVILCAQNATFDMKMVNTRYQGEKPRYPVFDTVVLFRLFLVPALQALSIAGDETANEKLEKLRVINTRAKQSEHRRGEGKFSSSLGKVRDIYGVTGSWHAAIADVQMLIQITGHVVRELRQNPDLDIMDQQASAAALQHSIKTKSSAKERKAKEAEELEEKAYDLMYQREEEGRPITLDQALRMLKQQSVEHGKERKYQASLAKAIERGGPEPTYPASRAKKKMMGKIKKREFRSDLASQGV